MATCFRQISIGIYCRFHDELSLKRRLSKVGEFHATRQPKEWTGQFQMDRTGGGRIRIDAKRWKYLLLSYPDGAHEILLHGSEAKDLSEGDRWQAAAIVLESMIGEEPLLNQIESFELSESVEPKSASKEKPINALPQAMGLSGLGVESIFGELIGGRDRGNRSGARRFPRPRSLVQRRARCRRASRPAD